MNVDEDDDVDEADAADGTAGTHHETTRTDDDMAGIPHSRE